jgi:cytochrome c biogenesis protein CcmG/thiol:disulfide interchange protein DsbE
MLKPLLLIFAIATYAPAQTPQELLRAAQDAYKSPEGYEIKGKGSVQLPNTSWQMNFEVTIAAAPSPPGNPQVPAFPSGRVGAVHPVNLARGEENPSDDEKPPSLSIPFAVTSFWTRIAENVLTVREAGSETLPLNGTPTACRVLGVEYKVPDDAPKPEPVTYSICSDRHLVLKKVMQYSTGRHATDPPAQWTILFDTARFNRPAPQWLLDMKALPDLTIRKEWIGRPAPDFELPTLDGVNVGLSSMRGKIVLLDFWSITCGPCLSRMPMIESVGEAYKNNVTLWGISVDPPDSDVKWLLDHQRTLPTLSDPDLVVFDAYAVQGIPALVLIGRNGNVRNYWVGPVPQSDIEAAILQASRH